MKIMNENCDSVAFYDMLHKQLANVIIKQSMEFRLKSHVRHWSALRLARFLQIKQQRSEAGLQCELGPGTHHMRKKEKRQI